MKISAEQLMTAVFGSVWNEEADGGIIPHRCSAAQEEAFADPLPYFHDLPKTYFVSNCAGCAGMKIDFYTDAKHIKLLLGGYSKNCYEVYVDGKFRCAAPDGENKGFGFAGKRERRITVYTSAKRMVFMGAELEDADIFRPAKEQGVDILMMGDSITQGVGASRPSCGLSDVLSRILDVRIVNQGNSGYVYDPKTITDRCCEPKLITLCYGFNDKDRKNAAEIEKDTYDYVMNVKKFWPEVPIVALIPTSKGHLVGDDPKYKALIAYINEVHRDAYIRAGVDHILECDDLMRPESKYHIGGHPNNAGYRIYGARLAKALVELGYKF